jgi:FKBP-type peptidyl-prolyl cis-trans isomerase FkpA
MIDKPVTACHGVSTMIQFERRVFARWRVILVMTPLFAAACGSSPTAPSAVQVAFSATDISVGTGTTAAAGKTVTVNYTGWLYDANATDHKGTQFDTSIGKTPFTFVLGVGQVIAGWDQGVVGMTVGGVRRLVIPPSLAYGSTGQGSIPPNATLVFDITLVNVQ